MARLRLFAGLREAAGRAEVQVLGATVAEVLENASQAFGGEFTAGLEHAQVWINGRQAGPEDAVREGDEVALIPPVSGGTLVRSAAGLQAAVLALVVVAVALANLRSLELFAGAMVAAGGLWVWDLTTEASRRGLELDRWPMLAGLVLAAVVPYLLGLTGLGLVVALVVVLSLGWGVARFGARDLPTLAVGFAVGLLGALGVGSLVVVRLGPGGVELVNAYLLMAVVAALVGGLLLRYPVGPFLDPLTGSSLGAVISGAVAGLVWGPSLVTMLLAGVAVALALIAGRALGSLLRTGGVYLIEPLPGTLAALDGAILAAAVFAPALALLV